MKFIDYIYYNLYDWYNSENTLHKSKNPGRMASVMLALSVAGWLMVLTYSYFKFIKKMDMPDFMKYIFVAVGFAFAVIFTNYYDSSYKYFALQKKYVANGLPYKFKYPILISFLSIVFPFMILLFFILYFA